LGVDCVAASLTILVDDEAFLAHVVVPRSASFVPHPPAWDGGCLEALGDMPLAIPLVAAATLCTAADVASLSPGDAWMPGAWTLATPSGARFAGDVVLAPPGATLGVRATLGEDGQLVLGGDQVELAMEPGNVNEAMNQAIGDVPVVVRVELGTAEMRAREWASLTKGDVISLGTKVADPVILRVGGVEVARGELVDVDGEVGVRILSRRA
jgi:flagellar motor switch/type III secretory pathway protein FliN